MKKEENKHSSNQLEEKSEFNVQRFLRKRWILPAVYLGAAAIVLSAFFMMQSGNNQAVPETENQDEDSIVFENNEAVPVTSINEVFKMPVIEDNDVEVVGYFYDTNATAERQEAALVYYNNTYYENKGIDIASKEGEEFEVAAALSGTVVEAEEDSLLGNVIQISHDNGVVTHYQSLGSLKVDEGSTVKQGDVIGTAGRNLYNSNAGVHVHFEIRHNDVAVNPLDLINQSLQTLVDADHQVDEEITVSEENGEENENKDQKEVEEKDKDKEEDKDKEKEE